MVVPVSLLLTLLGTPQALPPASTPAGSAAQAGLQYLRRVMDRYHDRFPVYDDVSECGNHFHAWAKIPDETAAVSCAGASTESPQSGATAIRCDFQDVPGSNFGGFYFQNGILPLGTTVPQPNWGTVAGAGVDLTGATQLCFWIRGATGGEHVEIFMGGVGRDPVTGDPTAPFPDSSPVQKLVLDLSTTWQRHCIPLAGLDLGYVLGGFGWVASDSLNPGGAVFFLDDIVYELDPVATSARLDEPRFLRSFSTLPVQELPPPVGDFDHVLRTVAFTYDNALALLAFLAEGTPDGLRRAEILGRAFRYAQTHDRTFTDHRVRDAYRCGDISVPPGWEPAGTVPAPGFYDEASGTFFEVEQGTLRVGNLAWAMIALLALHERTGDADYLTGARQLGELIQTFRGATGTFPGFLGGIDDPETPAPSFVTWSSTEHNLDVHAAFATMFGRTGESAWQMDSVFARQLVEAMWETARGCYLAGTLDPDARNDLPGQLPEDTQSWSVLATTDALSLHPQVLQCAETHHRTSHDGFSGFDFNDDRDGVWFEGTAHMALAYLAAGESALAQSLLVELETAQATAPWGDGEGIAAACHDGLTSGFGFSLFRRLHVGATAWLVFAELGFNPYTGSALSQLFADGFETGDTSAWSVMVP